MVAAHSASLTPQRSPADGVPLLASPGVVFSALFGLPVVVALSLAAALDLFGRADAMTWGAWTVAAGAGLLTILRSLRSSSGVLRRARLWLLTAYVLTTVWVLAAGATMHSRRTAPEPLDLLLLLGALASAPASAAILSRGVANAGRAPLLLDAGCILTAIAVIVVAVFEAWPGAPDTGTWIAVYPIAFFGAAGVGLLALVAAGQPLSLRGGHLIVPGTFALAAGCMLWVERWRYDTGSASLPAAAFAIALLTNAIGVATSGAELDRRHAPAPWSDAIHDALPLLVVAIAAAVLVAPPHPHGVSATIQMLTVAVAVFALAREIVLLRSRRAVLSAVRSAQQATRDALDRAELAEGRQRLRADQLARILEASEALVLVGDGEVSYAQILAAITPPGASSILARLDGAGGFTTLASHGGGLEWIGGLRLDGGVHAPTGPVQYHSASGRTVSGAKPIPEACIGGAFTKYQAVLAVSLVDQLGAPLGVLVLMDREREERVLDPDFVGLAQLVANQTSVALENQALVGRVRDHLAQVERVQEQLVQASKLSAIGDLAASIAHEVNNPLTGILGFSEILLDELPVGDPRHEEVEVIRREAIRARAIMRALLDFARPRPAHQVPTDLNALTSDTLDFVRYHATEIGVRIVEAYADVPFVDLDPDGIKQVILNLCNNALRAMPGGGELQVATTLEGDRAAIAIHDNGMGMDEETMSKLFNPFFATHSSATGGLGLPVSLQIAQSHGGTIEVSSVPGSGSTFTLLLPLVAPGARPPSPALIGRTGA